VPLVEVEDHGVVRVATMNRPQARNAMNTALLGALLEAVAEAVATEAVRVLVVTGAGGAFSAGADVKESLDQAGSVRRTELFSAVYDALGTAPIATVAAISGACVGGGIEAAAACDIRVADATARFRFPGAALGIPVGAGKLVGLVGLGAAKDLVLTSRTFDADEALQIGFVQRRAEPGQALAAALDIAESIARNHPDAVATLKRHFLAFGGQGDRIRAENDVLRTLSQAEGDYGAITPPDGVGGWTGGAWRTR
jgi:enoyl-CoA hydratase/carnithine racemase